MSESVLLLSSGQETLRQRFSDGLGSSLDSLSDESVAGPSADTDNKEVDDASSPTLWQRFTSWGSRILGSSKNATASSPGMSMRFFGGSKSDSMTVQCKNCKNTERIKGIFQNAEDFVCSV